MKYSFFRQTLTLLGIIFILQGCKPPIDPETGKRKNFEPNIKKKTSDSRDLKGGIFSTKGSSNNNFEFATSNVLWRAAIEGLDFIPKQSVSYSGGVIITDWYGDDSESIKIEINFTSSELKATSLDVKSFKKICKNSKCVISKNSGNLNSKLKNKIFTIARKLKIEDEQKKSKK